MAEDLISTFDASLSPYAIPFIAWDEKRRDPPSVNGTRINRRLWWRDKWDGRLWIGESKLLDEPSTGFLWGGFLLPWHGGSKRQPNNDLKIRTREAGRRVHPSLYANPAGYPSIDSISLPLLSSSGSASISDLCFWPRLVDSRRGDFGGNWDPIAMSYAYLFKYIIIGDTGSFLSISAKKKTAICLFSGFLYEGCIYALGAFICVFGW